MSATIEQLVHQLSDLLRKRSLTLSVAESCTGGGLGYFLTSQSGSSDWFDRGFITYSNAAKQEILGVSPQTLEKFGAVSSECAREMAEGTLRNSPTDLALSITGIAGPLGGHESKPVGTVWFGLASRYSSSHTETRLIPGDRRAIRLASIQHALNLLIAHIMNS